MSGADSTEPPSREGGGGPLQVAAGCGGVKRRLADPGEHFGVRADLTGAGDLLQGGVYLQVDDARVLVSGEVEEVDEAAHPRVRAVFEAQQPQLDVRPLARGDEVLHLLAALG